MSPAPSSTLPPSSTDTLPNPPTADFLVSYVEASDGDHPGHLVVGSERTAGSPVYVGYRFDPADLPEEYQTPAKWRDYLFANAVPGHIVDETDYVVRILAGEGRRYYFKRVSAGTIILSVLPPAGRWIGFARYSFNPDDHFADGARCYNCVTWGVETGNKVAPNFLQPVRQGRVKLIIQQMELTASGRGG